MHGLYGFPSIYTDFFYEHGIIFYEHGITRKYTNCTNCTNCAENCLCAYLTDYAVYTDSFFVQILRITRIIPLLYHA